MRVEAYSERERESERVTVNEYIGMIQTLHSTYTVQTAHSVGERGSHKSNYRGEKLVYCLGLLSDGISQ